MNTLFENWIFSAAEGLRPGLRSRADKDVIFR
jgi:hypothetical protein